MFENVLYYGLCFLTMFRMLCCGHGQENIDCLRSLVACLLVSCVFSAQMIVQKKTDRRRRRAESAAKTREDTKEQIPPAPASQPIRYQHDTAAMKKPEQGVYQTTPKYMQDVNGKAVSPKHSPTEQGDYHYRQTTAPPNHHQHPSEGVIPSPTADKPKHAQYAASQAVNKNVGGYTNYHQQPQQQSFAVGKTNYILNDAL